MTREEAIKSMEYSKAQAEITLSKGVTQYWKQEINWTIEAIDMAIEALKRERTDEWCTGCKEYDTEKKCCPRFNRVIREALKREPSEDGTLEVKVEDATKIGRVLISDDKHRGGLYYPDEDEPQGDLISRAEAIKSLNGEVAVMGEANKDEVVSYIKTIMMRIKDLPSAGRPRGEWIDEDGTYYANCSKCGYQMDTHQERGYFRYCPNCGADMRGEDAMNEGLYERATEQLEHDIRYEPTYNQDDGSM